MNQKALLLAVSLIALLVATGAFWCLQKQQAVVSPPVVMEPRIETPVQTESEKYPQHTESIPGNMDEVWYNIPEIGVRMKLNKGFAEDLIYSDGMVDDFGSTRPGIYFSTVAIAEVAPECAPDRGGAFGFIGRSSGSIKEAEKNDGMPGYYTSRLRFGMLVDFDTYFVMWNSPQATCWSLPHQDAVTRLMQKQYSGKGATRVFDGFKTIEPIPQK